MDGLDRLMNGNQPGPINIGNPCEFTIRQLADLVRAKIDPSLEYIYKPLPQDDPLQRKPVIDLAQRELSWCPSISLDAGLDQTIDYFKKTMCQPFAIDPCSQIISL